MDSRLATSIAKLILKRLAVAVPMLLLISLISFALINAAPGDALAELKQDPRISQETVNRLREQYGLDRPWLARYGAWLSGVLRGDFGISLSEQLPVTTLIGSRLGNTLKLSLTATFFALLIALPLGALAAKRRGSWLDRATGALTLVSLSTPRIVLAIIALVFAARTGLFPIGNVRSLNVANDWSAASILDGWHHLMLPAVVMSLPLIAVYLRQTRAGLLEVLAADFIRTARAKGLSEWAVISKHAARVAAAPLITLFGYAIAALLSGSVIVETVMAWPGIGQLAVNATRTRDLPVLMCVVMITAVMMLLGNLLADALQLLADPRLRETFSTKPHEGTRR
ncbi:MAG: ABC transporter permease [Acidobacteria bacterium]|nr:ABC transporter permease [Acidobacteriota bacterium]